MDKPVDNPIDLFIEGKRQKVEGREYITFVDFPILIRMKSNPNNIMTLRRRLIIDVTDEPVGPDSSQAEINAWGNDPAVVERMKPKLVEIQKEFQESPWAQDEAEAYLDEMEGRG